MEKQDVYSRITDKIVADLEKGVRPWLKPWNAENTNGRISRPLRHNGQPYQGINVLMLWAEASQKGYSAPIWMTFKQAAELKANVRKGSRPCGFLRTSIPPDRRPGSCAFSPTASPLQEAFWSAS